MIKIKLKKIENPHITSGCVQSMGSVQVLPDGTVIDHLPSRTEDELIDVIKAMKDVESVWKE